MAFINETVNFLEPVLLAFIPLFVAMEPIGIIPIYLSMTRTLERREQKRVLSYSVVTATAITMAFLIVGKAIFIALGITISDFQIAGGLILLAVSIADIVQTARGTVGIKPDSGVGVVPIGTPLIAGPAAITTIIMLDDLYGFGVTMAALAINLVIIWFVLLWSESIERYIGENGARGISKVISLLLTAIAVMMIRRGLEGLLL